MARAFGKAGSIYKNIFSQRTVAKTDTNIALDELAKVLIGGVLRSENRSGAQKSSHHQSLRNHIKKKYHLKRRSIQKVVHQRNALMKIKILAYLKVHQILHTDLISRISYEH